MKSAIRKHRKLLLGALLAVAAIAVLFCFVSWPSPTAGPANEKEMPEVMKELAQEEGIEWMAGIWVELPGLERTESDIAPGVDVYTAGSGPLHVTVTVQNGLDRVQPFDLVVFADGIPVEYKIAGESYAAYPVELTPSQTVLELELQPEFSLNLGRLDFLLLFDGDPQSDCYMTTYTVWLRQAGGIQLPARLQSTTAQRIGLMDTFSGSAYGAWLWNWDAQPAPTDQMGPKEITIRQGEKLVLEAIAARPGLYRTVMMLDGQSVSFTVDGETYSWLDWESNGTDMLQIPMELPENAAANGSFYTVTTPLGAESVSLSNLASGKIQIMEPQD